MNSLFIQRFETEYKSLQYMLSGLQHSPTFHRRQINKQTSNQAFELVTLVHLLNFALSIRLFTSRTQVGR